MKTAYGSPVPAPSSPRPSGPEAGSLDLSTEAGPCEHCAVLDAVRRLRRDGITPPERHRP